MNAISYVGAKLFYLGFRMQPLRIRRAISLMMQIGMEWQKDNWGITTRFMNGEHLDLGVGFRTEEFDPDASKVSQASREGET